MTNGKPILRMAVCWGLIVIAGSAGRADDVDYVKQIKPLLASKCYACHGALRQEANLRLETRSLLMTGGDSGAVIVPGDTTASLILERVTADEDYRMPPADEGAALKPAEIALLRAWIEQGAVAPDEEIPSAPTQHWAFQRIERPALPEADGEAMNQENPIDRLLGAKQVENGLRTQPPAERSLLIRRLYLDLIGLPPSPQQLHDARPWEEIVDELLASPQYGERWGRHWMDIWRYTDWYGLGEQLRNSQKHIWHWRDWIVTSLNADKGYDRMILEMLAGDELAPDDPDVVAGTGFLARNYYLFNRTTWLDDTIEHTGKAFLGLTINCAKCHDHKYDPISHVDYYSFRAIFEPHQVRLDPVPGVVDLETDGLPRVFDDHLDAVTQLHKRGDPKNPDTDLKIEPRVPSLFASFQPSIEPVTLPPSAYAPDTRDYVQHDQLAAAQRAVAKAEEALAAARKKLAETPAESPHDAETAEFAFTDEFDAAAPDVWDMTGDGWAFKDGALHQTRASRDAEFVRLKTPLPRDFDLTCRYTTTGGTTYKSVTFRFDESPDQQFANFVYTSAYEPGPKVQVAFTRDGKHNYPGEGQVARPIEVGKPYELRFAVRDRLVNVWLDGEFVVAYQLSERRPDGRFCLSGFDATVAFDSITIRSLPADVELAAAKNADSPSPQAAATAVKVAEAQVKATQARLVSLEATLAADGAKFAASPQPNADDLAKTAANRQAEALLADAEYELLAAGADENKSKTAQEALAAAQENLTAAENGAADYDSLKVTRKALEGPVDKEADYPATYSRTSSGRRLALARWMVSRDNPLTARVAVNHVWMRHFGQPLVESVFDFGLRADRPLHQDVLDYLAVELIESGWSFKHLHRLIVTSQAYQRSSSTDGADAGTLEADPTNRFYWRMNTRRMESQVVRDSLLQLAGTLDLTMGGPPLDVESDATRRSLYFRHSRDEQEKFLSMFDDADLLQCYRRNESIVPQQALALANSKLVLSMEGPIAQRIAASLSSDDMPTFIDAAFEAILGREPSDDERRECAAFCAAMNQVLAEEGSAGDSVNVPARVRMRLVHSLLNHNDYISIR